MIAALIRRMHEAKLRGAACAEVWGTGLPQRDFIFAEDVADACLFIMREYDSSEPINVGSGSALSIKELAEHIRQVVGYPGKLRFDSSKPDGMLLKVLDSTKLMKMGWRSRNELIDSLEKTYRWFLNMLKSSQINDEVDY